jgi:hypothetical protein
VTTAVNIARKVQATFAGNHKDMNSKYVSVKPLHSFTGVISENVLTLTKQIVL